MSPMRRRARRAFWRVPPDVRTVEAYYQYGIGAVGRGDGTAMMRAGWALWRAVGLHEQQAQDFLRDGYTSWRGGSDFVPDDAIDFLRDLFNTLCHDGAPPRPGDIWSAPPAAVAPAAAYDGVRAWAAAELMVTAEEAGRTDIVEEYESVVLKALLDTHPDFIPPRSVRVGRALAARAGVETPWPA